MINIAFVDWWDGFDISDNFITRVLDNKACFQLSESIESTDFVFCSLFGTSFLKYRCPRILFVGENCVPDFNLYDYAIGFDKILFDDRYIRYPLYVAYYGDVCNLIDSLELDKNENYYDREFCSFVVSNTNNANRYREDLFNRLSGYKFVASGGRCLNNIGIDNGVKNKIDFIKNYRFNLACENVSHRGYCTEKIIEAFAARTVPIYWGDPDIEDYFNPKAFINCNRYENQDELVKNIIRIDKDKDQYLEMLNQPVIIDKEYSFDAMRNEFEKWLIYIVNQKKELALRRSLDGWAKINEKKLLDRINDEKSINIGASKIERIKRSMRYLMKGSL